MIDASESVTEWLFSHELTGHFFSEAIMEMAEAVSLFVNAC